MQLTTVISDSFVAISALFAAKNIFEKNVDVHFFIKIIPFSLMIIAACTGILRFSYYPELANLHEALSAIASHVGMIFLGIVFYSFFVKSLLLSYALYALAILSALSALSFFLDYTIIYTKVTGTLAIVGIIGICITEMKNQKEASIIGIIACVFSMLAGAFQEFNITLGPLLGIDLFHYALSVANILWGLSLKKAN